MNRILPIGLLGILISFSAGAQEAWVSDQFEVMLRTGPSTSNAIERVLGSGTALEVLETDSEAGYARVRTTAGTEGWVLSRYLMNEPSAREQLERLTGQLTNATNTSSSNATIPHMDTDGMGSLAITLPLSPAKFVGEFGPVLRSELSELIPSNGSAPARKLKKS